MRKLILVVLLISGAIYSLMVDKGVVEKSLNPGDSVTEFYTVTNDEGKYLKVTVLAEHWPSSRQVNDTRLVDFQPNNFFLKAGDSMIVSVSAVLPKGTEGEKRYMIFFQGTPYKNGIPISSMFKNRIGYALYLLVKHHEIRKVNVTQPKISIENKKIKYAVLVKNIGNVHLRPLAYLEVFDTKNKLLNKVDFPFGGVIQPNNVKKLSVTTDEIFDPGKYLIRYNMYLDVYIDNGIKDGKPQMIVKVPVITEKNNFLFFQQNQKITITPAGALQIDK